MRSTKLSRWTCLAASLLYAFAALPAMCQNDAGGQRSSTSLGDVARQARQERTDKAKADARARGLARDMEEQEEENAAAPAGFKYYRGKGLPYSVLVPDSLNLDSRDGFGEWLTFSTDLTVIVGERFAGEGATPQERLERAALKYLGCKPELWHLSVNGKPAAIMWMDAECKYKPKKVYGSVAFYVDDTDVYPLICGGTIPDQRPPRQKGDYKTPLPRKSEPSSIDLCDGIFRSVRFREKSQYSQSASISDAPPVKSTPQQPKAQAAGDSLGEVARRQRQQQKTTAKYVVDDESEQLKGLWPRKTHQLGKDKPYLKVSVALPFQLDLSCCMWVSTNKLPSGRDITIIYNDWDLSKCYDVDCAEDFLLEQALPKATGLQVKGRAISRSNHVEPDYKSRSLDFLAASPFGMRYGNALLFHWRETTFLYACVYFEADAAVARDTCQNFIGSIRVTVPKEQRDEDPDPDDPPVYDSEAQEER